VGRSRTVSQKKGRRLHQFIRMTPHARSQKLTRNPSRVSPTNEPALEALTARLHALANPADAAFLQGFFKTGRGQYGEGDRFLGIRVPVLRAVSREFRELSLEDTTQLLGSRWHEARL